jgi:hypothetical protein
MHLPQPNSLPNQLEIAHKSFGQASRAPTPGNPAAWEPPLLWETTLHLSYG